jgi:hypothetical protein
MIVQGVRAGADARLLPAPQQCLRPSSRSGLAGTASIAGLGELVGGGQRIAVDLAQLRGRGLARLPYRPVAPR